MRRGGFGDDGFGFGARYYGEGGTDTGGVEAEEAAARIASTEEDKSMAQTTASVSYSAEEAIARMNGFQIGHNSGGGGGGGFGYGNGYGYGNGRRSNEDVAVAAIAPFIGHFSIVDAPTGGIGTYDKKSDAEMENLVAIM